MVEISAILASVWLDHLQEVQTRNQPAVVVTVAAVRGSAPREPGAAMVVTADQLLGTIGGGNLEFQAAAAARAMLDSASQGAPASRLQRCVLGPDMGQCCGGVVCLHYENIPSKPPAWFPELVRRRDTGETMVAVSRVGVETVEKIIVTRDGQWGLRSGDALMSAAAVSARSMLETDTARDSLLWQPGGEGTNELREDASVLFQPVQPGDFRVVLFGAGHVGRALVHVLTPLAHRVDWSDDREAEFPRITAPNVHTTTGDPFELIVAARRGSCFLVMTHSHSLDLALCESILQRDDFSYLGLIGSKSKRNRFERHLREEGLSADRIARMTCPIGSGGIRSKVPAAIAVSVAAELLQLREQLAATRPRTLPS